MTTVFGGSDDLQTRDERERRAEELLRHIVDGTAAVTGTAFFSSLVQHLAKALRVHRVYVAECLDADRARSRAVWMGGDFSPPFEYDLTDTPCMKVAKGQTCLYANHVQQYFPQNKFLPRMNAQSYLGIPLWNSAGRVIGHMVLVDDKPMSEDPLWVSVLETFAARAGAELEREQATERLREALTEVERLKNQLQAENVYLQEEIRREHNFEEMVGNSPALLSLLRLVERVAETDATVLIHGETGSGKELIARALHSGGRRRQRPLVKVNCGAVPPSLLESELFGHVKGAFTGAIDRRVGRFEIADGGTLFLDEIGELPFETQVKLLRVLQEQEFEPVGSSRTIRVDVRIIAATNRNLEQEVQAGRFRSDLFFRLNVVPLKVPSLRERPADIPLLVAFFLSRFAAKFGRQIERVERDTMDRLVRYTWPGNVRELQNVIERAVVLSSGPVLRLGPDFLPIVQEAAPESPDMAPADSSAPMPSLEEIERRHIERVLGHTNGVIEGPDGAARILDVHPNTLRSRMKKLGVVRPRHEISEHDSPPDL
jgi:formate hydrogenlyase transcriptional activator